MKSQSPIRILFRFFRDLGRLSGYWLALFAVVTPAVGIFQAVGLLILSELVRQGDSTDLVAQIEFPFGTFPLRDAILLLMALFLLSVVSNYVAALISLKIWQSFQIGMVSLIANQYFELMNSKFAASSYTPLVQSAVIQSVRLGAFARLAALLLGPLVRIVSFSLVAIWTSPLLSLILAPGLLFAGTSFSFVFSRRSSRLIRDQRDSKSDFSRAVKDLLKLVENREFDNSRILSDQTLKSRIGYNTKRLLMPEKASLVMGLASLVVGGISVLLGNVAGVSVSLGEILGFSAIVFLWVMQFQSLAKGFSTLGRFFPHLEAAYLLIDSMRDLTLGRFVKIPRFFSQRHDDSE